MPVTEKPRLASSSECRPKPQARSSTFHRREDAVFQLQNPPVSWYLRSRIDFEYPMSIFFGTSRFPSASCHTPFPLKYMFCDGTDKRQPVRRSTFVSACLLQKLPCFPAAIRQNSCPGSFCFCFAGKEASNCSKPSGSFSQTKYPSGSR